MKINILIFGHANLLGYFAKCTHFFSCANKEKQMKNECNL